jgi:hypothetical protein
MRDRFFQAHLQSVFHRLAGSRQSHEMRNQAAASHKKATRGAVHSLNGEIEFT